MAGADSDRASSADPAAVTPSAPGRTTGRGRAALPIAAAVLGAAAAGTGLLLVWATQPVGTDGSVQLSAKGYQVAPAVLPLILVVLAGAIASFAARGWVRTVVGAVVAGAALGVVVAALLPLFDPPAGAATSGVLPALTDLLGSVRVHWTGPLLAAAGGLAMTGCGIAVLARRATRRTMGSRFDRPGRSSRSSSAPGAGRVADPDAATEWWRALDAGADPTAEPGRSAAGAAGFTPTAASADDPVVAADHVADPGGAAGRVVESADPGRLP